MDNNKTIEYWIDGSIYDMETAEDLQKAGRYPYMLFFAHLSLEKLLKAIVVQNSGDHAPVTHSLKALASRTGIDVPDEILDKLAEYTIFNIESRYPDERKDFYNKCTKSFAEDKFNEIAEVYEWFHQKLDQ